jgi:hypothetical protein
MAVGAPAFDLGGKLQMWVCRLAAILKRIDNQNPVRSNVIVSAFCLRQNDNTDRQFY